MSVILVDKLLAYALARDANGFVLAAGYPPTLFLNDVMVDVETRPMSQDDVKQCADCLELAASGSEAGRTFTYGNTRVRASKSDDRVIVRLKV